MSEITFLSACQFVERLRRRELSAVEVVEAHLARIAAVNPAINAVVQFTAEAARADARRADAVAARGNWLGPLHGLPFTVKDWIETQGVICAAGYVARRTYVPAEDATVVARMRAAGAILLGKTNVVVENPVYGRTNNPYNLAYSPAGSSSGEAAIIAAGGSPLGLGSDSGGSIREPSAKCGIAGLKPTTGRVPLTGHFPRINAVNDPRTIIGPMARFVEDLALALPVIQGVDWRDASVVPMPLADWRTVDLRELRAKFYTHHLDADPSPEVVNATHAAVHALAAAGVQIEERLPPMVDLSYKITRDYWHRPEPESWDVWDAGAETALTSLEVEQHLFLWEQFRRAMIAFMANVDIIVTPVAELPARPHGDEGGRIAYTLTYSLTGYPAVVVRAGTSKDGMPIGVQVVARPWRDDVAIAAAYQIQQALGGWQPPPL